MRNCRYNVIVLETSGPVREGLAQLKNMRPKLKCLFMGTRATDPSVASMKSQCQFTDAGWPRYLRLAFSVCIVVAEYKIIKKCSKQAIFLRICAEVLISDTVIN